jgi:hypothetical protein
MISQPAPNSARFERKSAHAAGHNTATSERSPKKSERPEADSGSEGRDYLESNHVAATPVELDVSLGSTSFSENETPSYAFAWSSNRQATTTIEQRAIIPRGAEAKTRGSFVGFKRSVAVQVGGLHHHYERSSPSL